MKKLLILIAAYLSRTLTLLFRKLQRAELKYQLAGMDTRYLSPSVRIKFPENLTLGDSVRIGENVSIGAMAYIAIGDRVTISESAIIESATLTRKSGRHRAEPIVIGSDCWIGAGAIVLGGSNILPGTTVPAGKVIRKSRVEGQHDSV